MDVEVINIDLNNVPTAIKNLQRVCWRFYSVSIIMKLKEKI